MSDTPQPPAAWNDLEFLRRVDGASSTVPPLRVLFLAHRLSANGRLILRTSRERHEVHVHGGQVVSVSGWTDLLSRVGVPGEPGDDLASLLNRAVQKQVRPDDALRAAGVTLGAHLARMVGSSSIRVRFDEDATERGMRTPLLDSVPRIIAIGLREMRPPDLLRAEYGRQMDRRVTLCPLDAEAPVKAGLDTLAHRMLREARSRPSLSAFLSDTGDARWVALDLLVQLGLVALG